MSDRRVSLAEVEQQAKADLAKGGPSVALEWAFRHARAVARVTRAELAQKAHEASMLVQRLDLHDRSPGNVVLEALEALERTTAALCADAADLADARAIETACAHVFRILERTPARAPQPQQARPVAAPGKRAA